VDVQLHSEVAQADCLARHAGNPHIFASPDMAWQAPVQAPADWAPHDGERPVVIGFGPCGMFAALVLAQMGLKPIVIERGRRVRQRTKDTWGLWRKHVLQAESNVQFGEGGAGTFSDGKLYSQIKDPRHLGRKVMAEFVRFGAPEEILWAAHPHIGTNKLPQIIQAMRTQILDAGGIIEFEQKMVDFTVENGVIKSVQTQNGNTITGDAVVLATGHSANDIFELLSLKKIAIEAKPFALGVRIEHPQEIIDRVQYHCILRDEHLPPASYGLVEQVHGKGVFSFCMCPGGIIAPAATSAGQLVVNGWSPSKRNNPYANSGMVVQIDLPTAAQFLKQATKKEVDLNHPLLLLEFQQYVEQQAFKSGGGLQVAPAARLVDFCTHKLSNDLPDASYLPGLHAADLTDVLPKFVHETLQNGFIAFGKKMKGYYTNDAIVVATESRTSSPVRIPRDADSCQHPQIKNLYPCGEGAGYAGGIVSAAMDGQKLAQSIAAQLK
jgi:uncharacterized FAD-dependent dehydrogenase